MRPETFRCTITLIILLLISVSCCSAISPVKPPLVTPEIRPVAGENVVHSSARELLPVSSVSAVSNQSKGVQVTGNPHVNVVSLREVQSNQDTKMYENLVYSQEIKTDTLGTSGKKGGHWKEDWSFPFNTVFWTGLDGGQMSRIGLYFPDGYKGSLKWRAVLTSDSKLLYLKLYRHTSYGDRFMGAGRKNLVNSGITWNANKKYEYYIYIVAKPRIYVETTATLRLYSWAS